MYFKSWQTCVITYVNLKQNKSEGIYLDSCVYGLRHLFWVLRFPGFRRVNDLAIGHSCIFYLVLYREDKDDASCARSVCDIYNTCFPTSSARFAYSASPNYVSKALWSVYPNKIRAAANATKLNSNKYILYRNGDSGIISHRNLHHASPEIMHSGFCKDILSYKKFGLWDSFFNVYCIRNEV
jgi:hypothetical protein